MVPSEKSCAVCREFHRYTPPPVAPSSERRKYFRTSPGGRWKKGATSRKPLFTVSMGAPGGSRYWTIAVVIVFIFCVVFIFFCLTLLRYGPVSGRLDVLVYSEKVGRVVILLDGG